MGTMSRSALYFAGPRTVTVREEPVEEPGVRQVLVETAVSAISAGTELLFYRDEVPPDISVDDVIRGAESRFGYPLKYGYAAVGKVIASGARVPEGWNGRYILALHPHESHFVASIDEVVLLPETLKPEDAVFLPFMETAVNFVMDGKPLIGERVAVFGQGIIGLLTTALLALFPVERIITVDRHGLRRARSRGMGASLSLDPGVPGFENMLLDLLHREGLSPGADLTYELSGDPEVLNQAIAITGFSGRLVIGSWYGKKRSAIDLGARFHRSRIRIMTSQVSTLEPEFRGNWTMRRRRETALRLIEKMKPSSLVSHWIPLREASAAYGLLDRAPEGVLQVLLIY